MMVLCNNSDLQSNGTIPCMDLLQFLPNLLYTLLYVRLIAKVVLITNLINPPPLIPDGIHLIFSKIFERREKPDLSLYAPLLSNRVPFLLSFTKTIELIKQHNEILHIQIDCQSLVC